MKPKPNETLDTIKDIKLFQSKDGYRFSVDALLLDDFIDIKTASRGVELGAGSGIISVLLARRAKDLKIFAAEIQEALAGRAERNVRMNGLEGRVEILNSDMRELKNFFSTNEFDIIFSNPPYRKPESGRMSISEERAVARHEVEITLPELVKTASYLLKHSGSFYLIYHPFRLAELVSILRESRLEPKRMRFVHSRAGEEAKMVLIEAVKGGGTWLKIDAPLFIHEKGNKYTSAMKNILGKD